MIKPLRGMKDLAFDDAKRFEYFVDTASKVAKNYGYEYLETPLLEETALFKRSVGDSSDIVNKEMYQFTTVTSGALSPTFTSFPAKLHTISFLKVTVAILIP